MNIGESTWTTERVQTLTALWADGKSASTIARELSDHRTSISRNAVLSKVHRLGISSRIKGAVGRKSPWHGNPKNTGQPSAASAPQGEHAGTEDRRVGRQRLPSGALEAGSIDIFLTDNDRLIQQEQRKTLMQLRSPTRGHNGDCRWPIGSPGTPEFFFCGAEAREDKPYCAEHCRRAFVSSPIRRLHQNYTPGAKVHGTQVSKSIEG